MNKFIMLMTGFCLASAANASTALSLYDDDPHRTSMSAFPELHVTHPIPTDCARQAENLRHLLDDKELTAASQAVKFSASSSVSANYAALMEAITTGGLTEPKPLVFSPQHKIALPDLTPLDLNKAAAASSTIICEDHSRTRMFRAGAVFLALCLFLRGQ